MESIFLKIVNLSISAGWITLAIIILRLLFKKAPKWIHCVLWAFVGVRLVFPFSLESIFSIIPSAETIPDTIIYDKSPQIDSGISQLDTAINPIISNSLAPDVAASVNPMQIIVYLSSVVWIFGISVMILYALISTLLLCSKVRTAVLLRDNIRQSEFVSSPFVFGLFKPYIYIPYNVDGNDLPHIIAHEQAHLKRGDHWIKPIAFIILSVYWFNPMMWIAYILLCRDIELACDEKVITNLEHSDRKAYSAALLSCSISHRRIAACPLAFGETGVKERIESVMNYKRPALWIIVVSVLVCIVASICFLTDPTRPDKQDTHTLYLDDIDDMNIGAEMPEFIYADDNIAVLKGSFGIIIYSFEDCNVTDRISYSELSDLGISYVSAFVSTDGSTIYLDSHDFWGNPPDKFRFKYIIESKKLLDNDDKRTELDLFESILISPGYDGEYDKYFDLSYIISSSAITSDTSITYLQAKSDWSMKSLQIVICSLTNNTKKVFNVFPDYYQ